MIARTFKSLDLYQEKVVQQHLVDQFVVLQGYIK